MRCCGSLEPDIFVHEPCSPAYILGQSLKLNPFGTPDNIILIVQLKKVRLLLTIKESLGLHAKKYTVSRPILNVSSQPSFNSVITGQRLQLNSFEFLRRDL